MTKLQFIVIAKSVKINWMSYHWISKVLFVMMTPNFANSKIRYHHYEKVPAYSMTTHVDFKSLLHNETQKTTSRLRMSSPTKFM